MNNALFIKGGSAIGMTVCILAYMIIVGFAYSPLSNLTPPFGDTTGQELYTGCQGDGYSVTVGTSTYNELNPTGVDTLQTFDDCDSVVTTTLTFLPHTTSIESYNGCQGDGYSVAVGSSTYDESNPSGVDTLVAANGCDSVVTTALTFAPLAVVTASTPNAIDNAIGQIFSISSTVSNTEATASDVIYYCVTDIANASLTSLVAGGSTIAPDPASPSGQICFELGVIPATTDVIIVENWEGTTCMPADQVISRTTNCNCDASLVCGVTDDAGFDTGVNADLMDPAFDLSITNPPGSPASLVATICGEVLTFSFNVTNVFRDGVTLENVRAYLNLPSGFELSNPTGGVTLNAAGDSIIIGSLTYNQSLDFMMDLQLTCDAPASVGDNFELIYTYDELCEGITPGIGIEGDVITAQNVVLNIVTPNIQGNLQPTKNVFDAILGEVDTLKVPLTQGGPGAIDSFLYYVINPPSVTNLDVLVGGTPLSVAMTSGDTVFYWVDPTAIMNASGAGTESTLFEENETLVFCEVWEGTMCELGTVDPIIGRGARYGCQGSICYVSPLSSTGIDYGFATPELEVSRYDDLTVRPACYATDATTLALKFINTGNSIAKDIYIDLTQGSNPGSIIGSSLMYSINSDAGPFTSVPFQDTTSATGTVGSSGQCILGDGVYFRHLTAALEDIDLMAGDSLFFTYQLAHGCDCRACIIDNIYYSRVNKISWSNPCDVVLVENDDIEFPQFDARLQGFFEGESFATPTGCFDYQITSGSATWMSSTYSAEYPDAYFESVIIAETGMDITSVTHFNANGTASGATSIFSQVDGQASSSDTIVARTDRNVGGIIQICYSLDCAENPGGCLQTSQVTIDNYFVADDACRTSCIANASCQSSIAFTYGCPGCNPCEGLSILDLDINRMNYCFLDANNDFIPDDGTMADASTAKGKRFVQGDSLEAVMVGIVNDTMPLNPKDFAFLELDVNTSNFSILGGEFSVYDATDGSIKICNSLPQQAIGSLYITDLSPATLVALGCTDFAGFQYEDGDSLFLTVRFAPKEELDVQSVPVIYQPNWYLSDAAYGLGAEYDCNFLIETLNQIGIRQDEYVTIGGRDFGGCEVSPFVVREILNYGSLGFDEFCNEIRSPGIPEKFTFVKPPEFEYSNDDFGFVLWQRLGADTKIVNKQNGGIPSSFLIESGDTLCFLVKDYINSLGLPEVTDKGIDGGFDASFYPGIKGNCQSVVDEYEASSSFIADVNDVVFCQDKLETPFTTEGWDYTGGPILEVSTSTPTVDIFEPMACITIELSNITNIDAPFSWLNVESLTGGLTVLSIMDLSDNSFIDPTAFDMYELGTTPELSTREFEICVNISDCAPQSLSFDAGWDCTGYPATVVEATCSNPSTVDFITIKGDIAGQIIKPGGNIEFGLCDTICFIHRFSSVQLGSISDIDFNFGLPAGMTYIPGSFEIGYPVPFTGDTMWSHVVDPTNTFANDYQINVTSLNPELDSSGLVGVLGAATNANVILVRWNTITDCSYSSGARARFRTDSKDACDDPLDPIISRGPRMFIQNAVPQYDVDIALDDITLNPCNSDQATVQINMEIDAPFGVQTSVGDSIKIILPQGISYVSSSYASLQNASSSAPVTNTANGQTTLSWPTNPGLVDGNVIVFELDIISTDVGQSCGPVDMIIQTFSKKNVECSTGGDCDISVLSGDDQIVINVEKPELSIVDIDLQLMTIPPNSGSLNYTMKVMNNGTVSQESSNDLVIELWEDTDENGLIDTTIDMKVTEIVESSNIPPGGMSVVTGSIPLPPAGLCKVLAVINPETTCACGLDASNQSKVEVVNNFVEGIEVCSGELTSIGPGSIADYDYQWISIGGSNLGALSSTTSTPVDFTFDNTTGSDIVWDFALRTSFGSCFTYDTLQVTVYPETMDEVTIAGCEGESIMLPGPPTGSDFSWSPGAALSDSTDAFALLSPIPAGSQVYTLTYVDEDGCNASKIVNINAIQCSPNTAIGDTVWFDFNENGIQDLGAEVGIPNVTILLFNANNTSTGNHIAVEMTDANGYYAFEGLASGNYAVEFIYPPGFVPTTDNVGADGDDNDADPGTGLTGPYFLPNGVFDQTVDAGFIPDCSLDVFISDIGECQPLAGGGQEREIKVDITWTNAVYTSAFLGGTDTITLDILGQSFTYAISDLSGDTCQVVIFDDLVTTDIIAEVGLTLDPDCIAMDTVMDVTACIFDLALIKDLPVFGTVQYGDTLPFEITVENQGAQPLTNIKINDFLPSGFGFSMAPGFNDGWIESAIDTLMYVITDTLAPNESIVIPLQLELLMSSEPDAWLNKAEIFSMTDTLGVDRSDEDVDSTPDADPDNDAGGVVNSGSDDALNGNGTGPLDSTNPNTDEDDEDPELVRVVDMALIKTIVTPGPYDFGDIITFQIEVTNQGGVTTQNIKVNDYIPAGFSWVTSNEPNWMEAGGIAMDTIPGLLAPGASAITTIDLRLEMAAPSEYVNIAEIAYFEDESGSDISDDDIDSTPDSDPTNDAGGAVESAADNTNSGDGTGAIGDGDPAGDEDDADPAYVSVPMIDIEKTTTDIVAAASGVDGNFDATFEMVITNPGNQKLNMLLLQDDLTEQLGANFVGITTPPAIVALSDATTLPGVVSGYNGGVIDTIFNGMEGCLEPGQTITIEMVVEVTGMGGPNPIINEVLVNGKDSTGIVVTDMDTALVSAPDCFLSVVCPNPNQGIFACLEDIPPGATTENAFNSIDGFSAIDNSCGTLTITFTDSDNGGSGCIGDTLIITRQYIIVDSGVAPIGEERDTCEVVYTIVDDMKPIIMIPPSDLTIDCSQAGSEAQIINWENTRGGTQSVDNCNGALTESFVPTGTLIVECGGAFTQEYTYTAVDACGNSISEKAYLHNIGQETPEPQFDIPNALCWNGIAGSLTITPSYTASPGVTSEFAFSSATTNVMSTYTGVITVNEAGTFQICLTETLSYDACATADAGTCVRSICKTIAIVDETTVDPSWTPFGPLCNDNAQVDLDALVTGTTGGSFTGVGVSGTHPNYTFDPAIAGSGIHNICYSITTTEGCTAIQCINIEIGDNVDPTIEDLAMECNISPAGQINLGSLFGALTTPGGTFAIATPAIFTTPWINEIGYDDPGGDDMEFIEVAGPAGFDLSGCSLAFYDGGDQMTYNTFNLSGIIPNEVGGVGALSFMPPFSMQNALEGVALVCGGTLIEFLNYEGTFVAIGGPADGQIGIPIGRDRGGDGVGRTLQNIGSSSAGPWQQNAPESPGSLNIAIGQSFGSAGSGAQVVGGNILQYNEPGCYEVTYSVSSFDGAGGTCIDMANAFISIPEMPMPAFGIQQDICLSAGSSDATLTASLNSPTYVNTVDRTWSINPNDLANASASVSSTGEVTVSPTGGDVSGSFYVVLQESITNQACGTNPLKVCSAKDSLLVVVEDGTALDACFAISNDQPCIGDAVVLTANTNGGVFSGPGVVDDGNGSTATLTMTTCGPVSVSYTLTSLNGCTSTCSASITADDTPPVITMPADTILECDGSGNMADINLWLSQIAISTTCGSPLVSTTLFNTISGCGNGQTLVYQVRAVDECRNESISYGTIMIIDIEAPILTIPSDLTLTCSEISATSSPAAIVKNWCDEASASDVCGGDITLTHDFTDTTLDICAAADYEIEVVFTAVDECGNIAIDTATVFVEVDNVAPTITPPANLILDCGDLGAGADASALISEFLNGARATDDCDSDIIITYSGAEQLDACVASITTITWTAEDNCNNISTATATITVVPDTEAPVLTVPADLVLDCSSISATADASAIIAQFLDGATAIDNCDSSIVITYSGAEVLDVCTASETTITWTAEDGCGNVSMATAKIIVTPDTEAPILTVPNDMTIDCSSLGTADASFMIDSLVALASVTDNCDSTIVIHTSYNTDQLDLCADATYDIVITFMAEDQCGNETSLASSITIIPDTQLPVITAPGDITIDCSILGTADASFIIDSLVASASVADNCDGSIILNSSYNTNQLDLCAAAQYDIVITFTAEDKCGNPAVAQTTTITIVPDTQVPVITAPGDITIDCSSLGTADASFMIDSLVASASVTDNCDGSIILNSSYNTNQLDLCATAQYDIVITFTAEDKCGNQAVTETTTITIVPDTQIPVITAPGDITIDCSSLGTADASFIIDSLVTSASVSDNCDGNVQLNSSYNTDQLDLCAAAQYDIVIAFTAEDKCGNQAVTETTTITIVPDTQIPVITAPGDITIDCSSLGTADASFIIDSLVASASVVDNCDGNIILNSSYNTDQLDLCAAAQYDIVITFTAEDKCGNQAVTETTTITIVPDTQIPVITAPGDITIDCSSLGTADASFIIDSLVASASVADNCDGSIILNSSYNTDQLDLCAAATYDIVITFTAEDKCGNQAVTETTTITIVPDTQIPVITAPSDITIDCSSLGTADASFIIDSLVASASVADNCDGSIILNSSYNTDQLDLCAAAQYDIVITFTAEDKCGNQAVTETTTITIVPDTQIPVITAPGDITIDCSSLGTADASFIIDSLVAIASVTDNCDGSVVLNSSYNTNQLDLCAAAQYDIAITFTAEDKCGNPAVAQTTTITIVPDTQVPVITAPGDITIDCSSLGTADASFIIDSLVASASVTDNCDGNIQLNSSYNTNQLDLCAASTYDIVITFTAEDKCGNQAVTETTTITIVPDTQIPVITAPGDITIDCSSLGTADASFIIDSLVASASVADNCDVSIILNSSYNTDQLDLCAAAQYDIVITFTAEDKCGNQAVTETTTITIVPDTQIPAITAPGDITIDCSSLGTADASFIIDSLMASASVADNCDGSVILNSSYNTDQLDLCAAATYDIIITFTAEDKCGNQAVAETTTITIVPDTQIPVITAPGDITIDCSSLGTADASFIIDSLVASASVADNCDGSIILNSSYNTDQLDLCAAAQYDIVITFTAADKCGNQAVTETTTITIVPDTQIPVITAPEDITIDCSSLGSADASFIIDSLVTSASVVDNCDGSIILNSSYNTNQLDLCAVATYDIVITFTAEDKCGNQAVTETTTITIVPDTQIPVITAPGDITIDCSSLGTGDASFLIDSLVASASVTDNCDGDVVLLSDFNTGQLDLCATSTYDIVITFTASDRCGNQAITQTTTITIVPDTQIPVITAPDDITIDCSSLGTGDASFLIDSLIASASVQDNCDGTVALVSDYDTGQLDLCANETYDILVTFTASDICGNEAVIQTTTITIVPDVIAPTVICCSDFSVSIGSEGTTTIDLAEIDCGSTDNCTAPSDLKRYMYRTVDGVVDNGVNGQSFVLNQSDIGDNFITLVVEDFCGNKDSCEVVVTLTEAGSIDLTKRLVSLDIGEDGCANFVYEFNIENNGNVDLDSVQLNDDLDAAGFNGCDSYVATLTSDDFTVNESFDGNGTITLLDGADQLPVGDKGSVLMLVEACGCPDGNAIANVADVSAKTPGGQSVTDISNTVNTSINSSPGLGLAKRIVFAPILRADGCFDITYELKVKNYGDIPVGGIQITDDLTATFAGADTFYLTAVTSEEFDVNVNYDGGHTDAKLLNGKDTLQVQFGDGEEGAVLISMVVCSDQESREYKNQAEVTGTATNGDTVSDLSQDGSDPDPDGNGPAANNEPTPLTLQVNPNVELVKRVSEGPFDNGDGTFDFSYEIRVENTGDVPVQVDSLIDDLATAFAEAQNWQITRLESEYFEINPSFNGASETNLINEGELMLPDDAGAVFLGMRVAPGADDLEFNNTAFLFSESVLNGSISVQGLAEVDNALVALTCQNKILCPAWPDTIVQQNDAGWCFAVVNFPHAEPDSCVGTGAVDFEYYLKGVGTQKQPLETWLPGQPSGLEYSVGLTEVLIRYSFEASGAIAYSDTCQLYIDVVDKEAPFLMAGLPEDMTVYCCEPLDTFHLQQHHINDNCPDSLYIKEEVLSTRSDDPFDCGFYNYTDTIKWTVTDSSRVLDDGTLLNVSVWKQVITWIDTSAPKIILPPDITVTECLPDTTFNIIGYDIVAVDTVTQPFQVDDLWVELEVIIKDTIPVIDTVLNDNSYGQAIAIDKCSSDSVMAALLTYRDSIQIICKGDKEAIIHRIWSVTDPCGFSTEAIQRIIILDKNPPEIECVGALTVSLDANGRRQLTREDLLISVSSSCYDNTDNAEIRIEPQSFNCGDIGEHRVIITATDICGGETSYCKVIVTVKDTIAPVLNCPTDPIVISSVPDDCVLDIPALNNIVANGDCDVSISTDPPLFSNGLAPGMHTVKVTATDASGNMSMCEVKVDVQTTLDIPSSLACLASINLSLGSECTATISPEMLFLGPDGICPNFLCVSVRDEDGNPHPNFFDETDDGQEFSVSINDCNGDNNSCWGKVTIEMKNIPDVAWPEDVDLLCVEPTDPSYAKNGYPEVLNCVDNWSYSYQDNYINFDRCDIPRARIERYWSVFDEMGGVQMDTQIISILPYTNEHLLWPTDITIEKPLECGEVAETLDDIENGVLPSTSRIHPDSTGKPNLFGIDLDTNGGLCLYAIGYEDRVLDICDGAYQILRVWEVSDVCKGFAEGANPVSRTQVITVFDTRQPEIVEAPDTIDITINPWSCTYTGALPFATVQEDCSVATFEAYMSGGGYIEVQGSIEDDDLDVTGVRMTIGEHKVTNVFKDACGNVAVYNFIVNIGDGIPPVAIARESISVSLAASNSSQDGEGVNKVFKESIDAGSNDGNCSEVTTCILLAEELDNPIIIDDIHVTNDEGQLLYRPYQCEIDGVYTYEERDKDGKIVRVEEIPYVVCKDYVKFCCSDVGANQVALVVTDAGGLSATSWTTVSVEDKGTVDIVCGDLLLVCGDDYSVEALGSPNVSGGLCSESALSHVDVEDLDVCGAGVIERTWYVDSLVACVQRITIVGNDLAFDPLTIKWPAHADGGTYTGIRRECVLDTLNNGDIVYVIEETTEEIPVDDALVCGGDVVSSPNWCTTSCSLVEATYEDQEVVGSDACKKIIRRWTIVDWCNYNPNSTEEHVDHKSGRDEFVAINDEWLGAGDWLTILKPGELCEECDKSSGPSTDVYFRYTDVDVDGYYTYDQVIKIIDDTPPVIAVADTLVVSITDGAESKNDNFDNCNAQSMLTAKVKDLCGGNALDISDADWMVTFVNADNTIIDSRILRGDSVSVMSPISTTGSFVRVIWSVQDGCGNEARAESVVLYQDDKQPTPLCIQELSTAVLANDGTVSIWAVDYDKGSFDNCGEVDVMFKAEDGSYVPSLTLDCDDLTNGLSTTIDLELYVIDDQGNVDFCNVSLRVDDNNDACPDNNQGAAIIAGEIRTEDGDMVESTNVQLSSGEGMMTAEDGEYYFSQNPLSASYQIDPERTDNPINGVTVLDMVLIQRHIIGLQPLDSPYKLIAADINNDRRVTALDLVNLRRLVLGVDSTFRSNTSWRFVDADFEFVDPQRPWPFDEMIQIPTLDNNMHQEDFIGVKIGDVNSNVVSNSSLLSGRSAERLSLVTRDRYVYAGQDIEVALRLESSMTLTGLQYTLDFDGLEYLGYRKGQVPLTTEEIALLDSRRLTSAWHRDYEVQEEAFVEDADLYTLMFRPKKNGLLSEMLDMSGGLTEALAYDALDNEYLLSLSFDDIIDGDQLSLLQNEPNPFVEQTTIGFYIPEDGEIRLSVYDIIGQTLYEYQGVFNQGLHELNLSSEDLDNASSVLHYQLEYRGEVQAKKMVIVN